MLSEAGIDRAQCFLTNACRERPKNNDLANFIAFRKKEVSMYHVPLRDKMVKPIVREGYELLKREIELVKPNLIIACGNLALWALTGKWGIADWRGSELWTDQIKLEEGWQPTVIPIYHPAAILRQWSWRPIAIHDLKKAKSLSEKRERSYIQMVADLDIGFEQTCQRLNQLILQATWLSVDIETRAGHIACIGFAWAEDKAFCIPLMSIGKPEGYWSADEEVVILSLIKELLTNPRVRIIGQNFSYDAQYIERWWGFLPIVAHDTLIAQHSMFSNMPKDLSFLSSMYCKQHVFWKHDSKNWDKQIGEAQLWRYNCEDCCRTFEVAIEQIKVLESMGLSKVNEFQQSLFGPVHRAMQRGIKIDKDKRSKLATEFCQATAEREKWLLDVCGHPLNPRSPLQMRKFFVDDLGQKPVLKRRSSGEYTPSFDDECLRKMCSREPLLRPIVEVISDIRSLGIFFSTFIQAELDWDARIRCAYNIGGTKTYRFSSNETPFGVGTNLQNISTGDKE